MSYHRAPEMPLASFDPRNAELLKRGAQESFEVLCTSPKEARALRARIHTYRSQARKHYGSEGKEHWEPLYLCTIYYIEDKSRGIFLRFAPRHQEFSAVLDRVPGGVTAPQLEAPAVDSLLDQLELEQKANGSSE